MSLPLHLQGRIAARLREQDSPTRQGALQHALLVLAVALLIDLLLFFAVGGVRPGPRSTLLLVGAPLGSGAIALLSAWAAFSRGRSMLGRRRPWLLTIVLITPAALFAWNLLCRQLAEPTQLEPRIGWRCLAISLAMASWPLPLWLRARRERNPMNPGLSGAARAVAAGALTWLPVGLWCPRLNPEHLVFGHVLPLLVLALFGLWLGRRLTGVRSDLAPAPTSFARLAKMITFRQILVASVLVVVALVAGYASGLGCPGGQ